MNQSNSLAEFPFDKFYVNFSNKLLDTDTCHLYTFPDCI